MPFGGSVTVIGGDAGDGGDADPTTFSFAADSARTPLTRLGGEWIERHKIPILYGSPDGMTIYDDGVDVTSPDYGGWGGPRNPVASDLSDDAGWPDVPIGSGQVGIDSLWGRFRFYEGGQLREVGGWDVESNLHLGVYVRGHYAYLAAWFRKLDIVDISDPERPVWVGSGFGSGTGVDVIVDGAYAYVTLKAGGLAIYDVRDPTQPSLLSQTTASPIEQDYALHLFKDGDLVYVGDELHGVMIYDVRLPRTPVRAGRIPIVYAEAVWIHKGHAYVAGGNSGLQIYDVSDPSAPRLVGALPKLSFTSDVQVVEAPDGSGAYAFVAETLHGLRVVDVSNPANPRQVKVKETKGQAYEVRVADNYAFVGQRGDAGYLQVFDVCDPGSPYLLRTYTSDEGVSGVFSVGNLLYLANDGNGLQVLDPGLSEAPSRCSAGSDVTVDYNWESAPTAGASDTVTVTLQVALQGRGQSSSSQWQVPLTARFAEPWEGSVPAVRTGTSDGDGRLTIAGIACPGASSGSPCSYDIEVETETSLATTRVAQDLSGATRVLDMGTLLEGDIVHDGEIDVSDLAVLARSYGSQLGEGSFDVRADLNDDHEISISDLALLAANYGKSGPVLFAASGH